MAFKRSLLHLLAPRSLYARFLLIIIIPTVLVQAMAIYMFYERHWVSLSRTLGFSLSGEIAWVVDQLEHSPQKDHSRIYQQAQQFVYLQLSFESGEKLSEHNFIPEDYRVLHGQLNHLIKKPLAIKPTRNGNILVQIQMPDGVLDIVASGKRLANPTTYIFIMWMTGTALLLLIVSIIFLKNQLRSIVRLTKAAESFGKGQDLPDFKPAGATEIRRASIAFIEMRERIKRLLTRRTQMLAAVSHDLRTPLTRMRLRMGLMPENEDTEAMVVDMVEMEQMLESYLEFARSESAKELQEETTELAVKPFMEELVANYANHQGHIQLNVNEDAILHVRRNAFKRSLSNLLDNALRFGQNVNVNVEKSDDKHLLITIDDDGPGIPEASREEVFQPFYRIEESRNKETGGTGLGLAICRDIIHKHGGQIHLEESPLGGLRVLVELPL